MEFNQFIEKPNAMKCLNTLDAVGGLFLRFLLYVISCDLEKSKMDKKVSLFSEEVKI